jgi:hypothetical protein
MGEVLARSTDFKTHMAAFKMTGLQRIMERVDSFKGDPLP